MERYSGLQTAQIEVLRRIQRYLESKHIRSHGMYGGFVKINRDDMVREYPSDKIPEDKGGAYDLALQDLKVQFSSDNLRMVWGLKTDDDLFLEVFHQK